MCETDHVILCTDSKINHNVDFCLSLLIKNNYLWFWPIGYLFSNFFIIIWHVHYLATSLHKISSLPDAKSLNSPFRAFLLNRSILCQCLPQSFQSGNHAHSLSLHWRKKQKQQQSYTVSWSLAISIETHRLKRAQMKV